MDETRTSLTNEELTQAIDDLNDRFDTITDSVSICLQKEVERVEKQLNFRTVAKGVGVVAGIGALIGGGIFIYKNFIKKSDDEPCDGDNEDNDDMHI